MSHTERFWFRWLASARCTCSMATVMIQLTHNIYEYALISTTDIHQSESKHVLNCGISLNQSRRRQHVSTLGGTKKINHESVEFSDSRNYRWNGYVYHIDGNIEKLVLANCFSTSRGRWEEGHRQVPPTPKKKRHIDKSNINNFAKIVKKIAFSIFLAEYPFRMRSTYCVHASALNDTWRHAQSSKSQPADLGLYFLKGHSVFSIEPPPQILLNGFTALRIRGVVRIQKSSKLLNR